jgi:hypothetical protein
MYQINLRGLATVLLLSALGAAACSRDSPSGSAPKPNIAVDSDFKAEFDPKTLKECKQFADLPEGVQALANNSFMRHRYDGNPTKFVIGGVGESSAIVAYEEGGFVPSYNAQSYVLRNSLWTEDRHWWIGEPVTTLSALISETSSKP